MKKFFSLYKPLLIDTLSNKFVFIFNIVLPIGMFIISNSYLLLRTTNLSKTQIISGVSYYFSYIVFISVLNLMILPLIVYRESGYYKFLYFLTKSKWTLIISNLFVQFTFIILELLIFNIVVMIITHTLLWSLLLETELAALLLTVPVVLGSCVLLNFRIRIESASIVISFFIFLSFSIATLSSKNFIFDSLLLLNPIKYLSIGFNTISQLPSGISINTLLELLFVTIIYLVIGITSVAKYNIRPLIDRG